MALCYHRPTLSVFAPMYDSLPLTLADAALRGALLAVLLLLAIVLLRERTPSPVRRIGIALTLGLCVQVIGSLPLLEETLSREWLAPLVAISVGNAVLFWVFVLALFDDEFVLRPLHIAAWLAAALLGGCNCGFINGSASLFAPYLVGLQRAVPMVFAILAALAAIRRWRDDLVESRRKLRAFVVVTGVAYTLAMAVVRIGSARGRLDSVTSIIDIATLLAMLVPVALLTFRLNTGGLFAPERIACLPQAETEPAGATPTPEKPDPLDADLADLAEALQRAMTVERAYRDEGLSVAGLAARLAVRQYRLRRLINQRLGYRNFNAYINSYRLEEARAALADPAQNHLPILTIALEAGFQSIGPFNRAFKSALGLTPTEFRQKQSPQS